MPWDERREGSLLWHQVCGEDLLEDVGQLGSIQAHVAPAHGQIASPAVGLIAEGGDEDDVAVHLLLHRSVDRLRDRLWWDPVPAVLLP